MKFAIFGTMYSIDKKVIFVKFMRVARSVLPESWYLQFSKWLLHKFGYYYMGKTYTLIQIKMINLASRFPLIKRIFRF